MSGLAIPQEVLREVSALQVALALNSDSPPGNRKVYTFNIELLGSTNPVIKRTVDVPSWYTFQYFHFVIQYAFGPWEQCHLHEFSYSTAKANRSGGISLDADESVLKIIAEGEEPEMPLFGGRRPTPTYLYEKEVKLSDMYDEAGKHRALASKRGEVLPLTYVYDFGVRSSTFLFVDQVLIMCPQDN